MKIAIDYLKKQLDSQIEDLKINESMLKNEVYDYMKEYFKNNIERNKKAIESIKKAIEFLKTY